MKGAKGQKRYLPEFTSSRTLNPNPSGSVTKKRIWVSVAILWFRNNLRLRDNAVLEACLAEFDTILPVFVFDHALFEKTSFGFVKTGEYRTTFLKESVLNLKKNLQDIGADLWVETGSTSQILSGLCKQTNANAIFTIQEMAHEEKQLEKRVEVACQVPVHSVWDGTLFHLEDLPFNLQNLPPVFTSFRKKCEKNARIRPEIPAPENFKIPNLKFASNFPVFKEETTPDSRRVLHFKGGETEAWKRIQHYLWASEKLSTYKHTRNGLLGADYSSKFSAWLANGCISAVSLYHEIREYEKRIEKNSSTYWLVFELMWRDYFRFIGIRWGNKIFSKGGILGKPISTRFDDSLFDKWRKGETGVPFVDANMRELLHTGFMSNRGRQNVASFLVKDLQLDWRAGAEWFESQLVDYDVYSNYGNWNYVAGVGNDPREDRYFNVVTQAKRYDPQALYIKRWLPELNNLSANEAISPWKSSSLFPPSYPNPVVKGRFIKDS